MGFKRELTECYLGIVHLVVILSLSTLSGLGFFFLKVYFESLDPMLLFVWSLSVTAFSAVLLTYYSSSYLEDVLDRLDEADKND